MSERQRFSNFPPNKLSSPHWEGLPLPAVEYCGLEKPQLELGNWGNRVQWFSRFFFAASFTLLSLLQRFSYRDARTAMMTMGHEKIEPILLRFFPLHCWIATAAELFSGNKLSRRIKISKEVWLSSLKMHNLIYFIAIIVDFMLNFRKKKLNRFSTWQILSQQHPTVRYLRPSFQSRFRFWPRLAFSSRHSPILEQSSGPGAAAAICLSVCCNKSSGQNNKPRRRRRRRGNPTREPTFIEWKISKNLSKNLLLGGDFWCEGWPTSIKIIS